MGDEAVGSHQEVGCGSMVWRHAMLELVWAPSGAKIGRLPQTVGAYCFDGVEEKGKDVVTKKLI